jgi:uncharacterized protein YbbC (DUF1343 family)
MDPGDSFDGCRIVRAGLPNVTGSNQTVRCFVGVSFPLDGLVAKLGAGARVGVVCTPASLLEDGRDLIAALPRERVTAFLALEHGLRGELQDGVVFDSYVDRVTGLPVYSFYGSSQGVPPGFLEAVDVVVFCVQDVSHRAYTFKQALASLLSAAVAAGTPIVVLDRPTPLAHWGAWGPLCCQFFPVPLTVGIPFTLGELARCLVAELQLDVDLSVLAVRGWERSMAWPATGLAWVPPSPNVPTVTSAYAYALTGLLQATNVSEGRGTCKPFEFIGAPFLEAEPLAERLNSHGLPGLLFRPVYFQPQFGKYAGEVCAGVHVLIMDPLICGPMRAQLTILQEVARGRPETLKLTPGFGRWLDGAEDWSPERLRDLDVSFLVDSWSVAACEWQCRMESHALYH